MKDRAAAPPPDPHRADAGQAGERPSEAVMPHSHAAATPPIDERLVAELPALRAYVSRIARGADIDDLLQEALARALRYRGSFETGRAVGPWLRSVAWRVVLDRRKRRTPESLTQEPPDAKAIVGSRADDVDELNHALSALSDVERVVLVRFHGHGESVQEIAAALAMPAGTVKSHLHRARRKLAGGGST